MRKQRLFTRLLGGVLFAAFIILLPCPVWTPEFFTWWQVPAGVLFLVLYLGVLLFDTLFFDRRP